MKDQRCLLSLDFDSLRLLADACLPAGAVLALCDEQGKVAWQSGEPPSTLNVSTLARHCWQEPRDFETTQPITNNAHGDLHVAFVRRHDGDPAGVLLGHFPATSADIPRASPLVRALAAGLSRELQILSELEDMADDLTDRYEELNLVFALDADLRDASKAHQALHQLLRNCVEYRRAEFALLLHPEIQFSQHYGMLPASAPAIEPLIEYFRNHLLPKLQADDHTWIDNHAFAGTGDPNSAGYKILAVPVKAATRGTVGILVWLKSATSPDFTNSSRNLLEAMSQRVELIVTGSFDLLTGLLNRSNFELSLRAHFQDAHDTSNAREKLFLLHLDIDYLQILNDTMGVQLGDQLIRHGAHLISSAVGDHGLVAHFGGGKFYLLLRQPSLETARLMAQTLCAEFQGIQCGTFAPTLSIGLTPLEPGTNHEDSLAIAKAACAHAKKQGRNRVQTYESSERDFLSYKKDMEWFKHIHQALAEDRMELFGQAICPVARTATLQHFEVLLRMRGNQGEIIPPGMFLPTAERYNLMTLIDRHVIEKCFDLLHRNLSAACQSPLQLSVNLSAQSINDPEFQTFLLHKLETHPRLAQTFCFEVTETSCLTDLKDGDDFLGRLQSYGCRCALDDFGTGVSSFSYLQNLRVNSVKIDGSFIKLLSEDAICQAIVRSIRDIAALKGIATVAEFVENEAILLRLAAIGIDYAQGYGVHKPEPLEPLLAKLPIHIELVGRAAADSKIALKQNK